MKWILGRLFVVLLWLLLGGLTLWTFGALWFDFPSERFRQVAAWIYVLGFVVIVLGVKSRWRATGLIVGGFVVALAWWLMLQPSNNRQWQPNVAETAWAEINGERVTLHNVRNFEYRTESDYTPRWETRVMDLARLQAVDIAVTYWGSKWIAHPILSFQFEDAPPVCFSVETRLENGEEYSAIRGLYRRCELIYVCADERDVIRLRSNFRKGEEVYLFRTTMTKPQARQRFLEYLDTLNSLHKRPRWYNAVTTNCTTSVRTQHAAGQRAPWDWRILLNGFLDQLLYEKNLLAGDLPFPQLKVRAHINEAARAANDDPDFSKRIRASRPGF